MNKSLSIINHPKHLQQLGATDKPPISPVLSKIAPNTQNSNLMIALAEPLLLICSRLHQGYPPNDVNNFHLVISSELHIFTSQCKLNKISQTSIDIAKTTLLGAINSATSLNQINSKRITLDQNQQLLDFQIYSIIHSLIDNADEHIDLIELLFLCFKIGYHDSPTNPSNDSANKRTSAINEMYLAIRRCKGDVYKNLFPFLNSSILKKFPLVKNLTNTKRMTLGIIFFAMTATMISCYVLDQNISFIDQQIKNSIHYLNPTTSS